MGLFRGRAWRNRKRALAEPIDNASAEMAPVEIAPVEIAPVENTPPEMAPAEIAPAEIAPAEELTATQHEAGRQKVTAEARPNPDQPGWGRIAGQALSKAREDRQ